MSDKRIKAAKQLGALFNVFPDKNQAYSDLVILAKKDNYALKKLVEILDVD